MGFPTFHAPALAPNAGGPSRSSAPPTAWQIFRALGACLALILYMVAMIVMLVRWLAV